MGVRYRFVIELDVADESDPDFERPSNVNSTVLETRDVDPELHGADVGRVFQAAEASVVAALIVRGLERR